ncbi:hypothetical protein Pse7429DRAFT_4770, partial [Pseudanabaena biceps PCC 7429]
MNAGVKSRELVPAKQWEVVGRKHYIQKIETRLPMSGIALLKQIVLFTLNIDFCDRIAPLPGYLDNQMLNLMGMVGLQDILARLLILAIDKKSEADILKLNQTLEARVAIRTQELLERESQLRDFFDNA